MAKREPPVGAVIEIRTPEGLAYAQYVHYHKQYGNLVRILPGLHARRPESIATLVNLPEAFWIFIPLVATLKYGQAELVGTAGVPPWASAFPLMRMEGGRDRNGKVHVWWLFDGEREWRIGELPAEYESLSPVENWTPQLLAQRLAEGWTPAEEARRAKPTGPPEPFRSSSDEPASEPASNVSSPSDEHVLTALQNAGADLSQQREINHYLYFPKKRHAKRAAKLLKKRGFETEVDIGGDDISYRVKASHFDVASPERVSALRDELSEIASSLGGDYDGWEAAVEGSPTQ